MTHSIIIQNTGDFVRHMGKVKLPPGTNIVSGEEIEIIIEAREHPINQYLIEAGELVLPDDLKVPHGITKVNTTKAGILINDTFDLQVLDEFLEEEQAHKDPRSTVINAINKRIKAIKEPPEETKYKKSEDDDGTGGDIEEV